MPRAGAGRGTDALPLLFDLLAAQQNGNVAERRQLRSRAHDFLALAGARFRLLRFRRTGWPDSRDIIRIGGDITQGIDHQAHRGQVDRVSPMYLKEPFFGHFRADVDDLQPVRHCLSLFAQASGHLLGDVATGLVEPLVEFVEPV